MSSIPSKSCPLPAGSKVFTYARDSGGDTQERSVDEQIRLYDAYAEQHGLIVVRHFHDRARPGSSMVGRAGLEQLLAEARRQPRPAAGILFWSMDRLSRNQLESQFLKSDLRLRGFTLVFISNDIPDIGDLSPVFESLIEWKASEDLKAISRNSKRGLSDLVSTRRPDGAFEGFAPGIPPRGFKGEPVQTGRKRDGSPRINQRWIPDPRWWNKCCEAWELRAGGWSISEIDRKLHLFSRTGCYTTFFRNPIYKGEFHYGGQVLKDFVTRMVDDSIWAKVGLKHDALRKCAPARIDSKRLFAGLAYCAQCGARLRGFDYRKGGKVIYQYYGCTGREKGTCTAPMIRAAPFEREVMEKALPQILTVDRLRNLAEALRRQIDGDLIEANETIGLLQRELQSAEKAVRNLVESGTQAPLSDALGKALEEQERRANEIRGQIAELKTAKTGQRKLPEFTDEALQVLADRLKSNLCKPTPEARAALRLYITRIVAEKKRAVIYYTFPIEDSAADEGGASVFYRYFSSPVGALAERSLSVDWILPRIFPRK